VARVKIAALSLQYVPVNVAANLNGSIYNPTGDGVQMAFKPLGQQPGNADWQTALWVTAGSGELVTYQAVCLVGPSGTIQLTPGTYGVWVKVTDNPEIPVMQSPEPLTVY
jgi:hypothetical protein